MATRRSTFARPSPSVERSVFATLFRKSSLRISSLIACKAGPKAVTVTSKLSQRSPQVVVAAASAWTDLTGFAIDSPSCSRRPWEEKSTLSSSNLIAAATSTASGLR